MQTLQTSGDPSAGRNSQAKSEEADIHMLTEHLQCLYDFMQTDLAHLHGLRLKVQDAKLRKISFDELYYLFSPGDLVIHQQ